jgi:hypothetical protein
VSGVDPQPITADSLRLRAEWQAAFPASTVISEETADEGRGIGFDGLDPSAVYFTARGAFSETMSPADA